MNRFKEILLSTCIWTVLIGSTAGVVYLFYVVLEKNRTHISVQS